MRLNRLVIVVAFGLHSFGFASLANARDLKPAQERSPTPCLVDSAGYCIPNVANPASTQGSAVALCLCPTNHLIRAREPRLGDEIALGFLQVIFAGVGAVGAGAGSLLFGEGGMALAFVFVPLLPTTAVWGLGHLSSSYEPRFGYTLLGAFLGAVLGAAIGAAATSSMLLDVEDPNSSGSPLGAFMGVMAGSAVGAVVAHHISKKRRVAAPAPMPVSFTSPVPIRQGPVFPAPRALMFSLVSTTF